MKRKREVYTSRWKFTAGRPSSVEPLRRALGSYAFQGALAANVDFDLFRLGFGFLRQLDLQHALVIVGRGVLGVNCVRQSEGAGEAAILPLYTAIVLFLLVFLELALAMHGHRVVLDADINIFLFDARNLILGYVLALRWNRETPASS